MKVDLDILIYAVVAAVLLGRLWSVFGTRTGNDTPRPNPFAQQPKPQPVDAPFVNPTREASRLLPPTLPPNSLAGGLAAVKTAEPTFEEKAFLREVPDIFSAVVAAYAAGNLPRVSEFLSPELLGHFQRAVDARASAGQVAQSRVVRFKEVEAIAARAEEAKAFVTVRFVSEQENIVRNAEGALLGGEEGKTEDVTDIWTFAKDGQAPAARWVVVETRG